MAIRDVLIAVGLVVLLVVAADLLRRYLQRGKLRLSIDQKFSRLPDIDLSAELPNGGARVLIDDALMTPAATEGDGSEVDQWSIDPLLRGTEQDSEVDLLLEQEFRGIGNKACRDLNDVALKSSQQAVDPEALADDPFQSAVDIRVAADAESFGSIAVQVVPEAAVVTLVESEDIDLERPVHELLQVRQRSAATAEALESSAAASNSTKAATQKTPPRAEEQPSFFDLHPDLAPVVEQPKPKSKSRRRKQTQASVPADSATEADDKVKRAELLIRVQAKQAPFRGPLLFKLVELCGLRYGAMDIFHRHEQEDGQGALQFSMFNASGAAQFDLDGADQFSTPAVAFYLRLSDPTDRMHAFDCMLETAKCIADNLGGDLKDENQSSLRPQTIEHYRQKVRDFERKQLSRRD